MLDSHLQRFLSFTVILLDFRTHFFADKTFTSFTDTEAYSETQ